MLVYIYFIIQFHQHNIKVKVTVTCFDLTSHIQTHKDCVLEQAC